MIGSKVYNAIKQSQSSTAKSLIFITRTEGNIVVGFLNDKLEFDRNKNEGDFEYERVRPSLCTQDFADEIYADK